jgi:protocatechuate 3,4-dioxygenase, alpha subunit
MGDSMNLIPTPSQTVGPYLHLGLAEVPCIAAEERRGERLRLLFRVLDGDGIPVPDAIIELWQADSKGEYPPAEPHGNEILNAPFRGFGRMSTRADGSCTFDTIKPGRVRGPDNTPQAPHINVSILGRGLLKRLSTRAYFSGDPANASDPVLALVPGDRRITLFAQPDPARASGWIFEIRLSGDGETVFFDV